MTQFTIISQADVHVLLETDSQKTHKDSYYLVQVV
jgi:hypothetical protein